MSKTTKQPRPPERDEPAPLDYAGPLSPTPSTFPPALRWMLGGFVGLFVIAVLAFHSPSAMARGNPLSWPRAVFAAANALTLTGFQQTLGVNDYETLAQVMAMLLTVCGTLLTLIAGGWALVRILRLPYRDDEIVWAAVFCQAAALFLGALIYLGADAGETGGVLAGPFQGAAAFANSGLVLGELPALMSWRTHLVLLPLAVIGGLGVPVLLECRDALRRRRPLSFHSRTALLTTAALYLAGVLLLVLLLWSHVTHWDAPDLVAERVHWPAAWVGASTAAVVTRSAGLPYDFTTLFPTVSTQFAGMLLMLVGGSPGGAAGGLKTTTLAQLCLGTRHALRGRPVARTFGLAAAWLAAYLGVVLLFLLLLLQTEPQLEPHRVLFIAVSAVGCVGLAHNPLAVSDAGLFLLAAATLAGRLLPLLLLWHQARTAPPDAALAIG